MISIYILINSIDDSAFYVGASQDPHGRLLSHINNREKSVSTKNSKICEIISAGGSVELEILDQCFYYHGRFFEQFYMDLFRSFGFTLMQGQNSNYNIQTLLRREAHNSIPFLSHEERVIRFKEIGDFDNKLYKNEPISLTEIPIKYINENKEFIEKKEIVRRIINCGVSVKEASLIIPNINLYVEEDDEGVLMWQE